MYDIRFLDITDRALEYIITLVNSRGINLEIIPNDYTDDLSDIKMMGIAEGSMPTIMLLIFHHIDQDQYREIIIN